MARLTFDLSVLRVLLVEEDTFSRELEKTALQELGISTINYAHDESEALDALVRGLPCDLIVFDWNMPLFDGAGLVGKVRKGWPGTPILMLTNNEGLDQIKMAQDAGVDGCLIKPFSLDKLRAAIQLALISKLTSGKSVAKPASKPADPELTTIAASIKSAIASAADTAQNGNDSLDTLRDANRLAANLSDQLTGFVGSLSSINQPQMDVIQLHVDCMQVVLTGNEELLAHETRNLIVDGLNLAADLVSN